MLENIKTYLLEVGIKKYAPVLMMSAMTALGTLMAAHAGMLESWGVNYVASWSTDWLTTHTISGPVLLIELDTTSTAAIAAVIGLMALLSRAGEHHVTTPLLTPHTPPPPLQEAPK